MKNRSPQFGPWTTTLHYGSRLELSAFWQRRLGRLESLRATRSRISWASAIGLVIVAGTLVALPRLRMEPTVFADDSPGQSASASSGSATSLPGSASATKQLTADEQPFTATFSNGVKVQLIGLSENPSQYKPWWAPDGTMLDKAPYVRVPAIMHPGEQQLAREICFRWLNKPDDPDFETNWGMIPPQGGTGGGIAYDANGQQVEGLTAWAVIPRSQETCTVRFSVSIRATPWTTVFTNKGRNLSAMGGTIDGVQQGAIFGEPYAKDEGTSITVSSQVPGKAVRLLAVDNEGLADLASSRGGAGALGFSQTTYHFANLEPDKIQRFELQSQKREFESIEFRNVSLHPDKQTTVEIVRTAPENKTPRRGASASASVQRSRIGTLRLR